MSKFQICNHPGTVEILKCPVRDDDCYEKQCEIYKDIFKRLGLPYLTLRQLRYIKIPKTKSPGWLTTGSYMGYHRSLLEHEDETKKIPYNLPPGLHWSLVLGWTWPGPDYENSIFFYEGTPSHVSTVEVNVGGVSASKLALRLMALSQRNYSPPQVKIEPESPTKFRPRFRFVLDRCHQLSDEDSSEEEYDFPPRHLSKKIKLGSDQRSNSATNLISNLTQGSSGTRDDDRSIISEWEGIAEVQVKKEPNNFTDCSDFHKDKTGEYVGTHQVQVKQERFSSDDEDDDNCIDNLEGTLTDNDEDEPEDVLTLGLSDSELDL